MHILRFPDGAIHENAAITAQSGDSTEKTTSLAWAGTGLMVSDCRIETVGAVLIKSDAGAPTLPRRPLHDHANAPDSVSSISRGAEGNSRALIHTISKSYRCLTLVSALDEA